MRHRGTPPLQTAISLSMSRPKAWMNRAEKSGKLNDLKAFRIPSRESNGSPKGGLASVNPFHIWVSTI
jgi:hypothetical protein